MRHLTKEELACFLPHAGNMCLVDRVEEWDDTTIRCYTSSHHDPTNPLRHRARLDAVAGLEYAAQAMGLHVGLGHQTPLGDGIVGYVGGLRDVVFNVVRLDECRSELTVEATRLFGDEQSFMYQFTISSEGKAMLTGRASIFLKRVRA